MMGGFMSWLWIVQAVLIGVLFLVTNYYLWIGMARIPGAERFAPVHQVDAGRAGGLLDRLGHAPTMIASRAERPRWAGPIIRSSTCLAS